MSYSAGAFAIGDTVYAGKRRAFPGIPSFSPELFAYLKNPNPSKYKQFSKALDELLGEGAVQVPSVCFGVWVWAPCEASPSVCARVLSRAFRTARGCRTVTYRGVVARGRRQY